MGSLDAGQERLFVRNGDKRAERVEELLERLCARLGVQAVRRLAPYPDHRPERAWRCRNEADSPGMNESGVSCSTEKLLEVPRPLWLLREPLSLPEGSLIQKAGPERIETGWWDGPEVRRDYFVGLDSQRRRLWVYRTPVGEWYVHGIFA